MTPTRSLSRSPPSAVSANAVVSSLLTVQTAGAGFVDLTAEVAKFVHDARAREGAATLFIRHTSASLTIQENADPSVLLLRARALALSGQCASAAPASARGADVPWKAGDPCPDARPA